MNRRSFVGRIAAAALASRFAAGQQSTGTSRVTLEIASGGAATRPVPEDFVGLSYEAAQLANPMFFSAENKGLIALVRDLAPKGNLRIGGGSSEFTTYSDKAPAGPPPFEVFGPDTSKTVKRGTVTSAVALRNLRAFLDATDWNCLYALNLGQGTVENAVKEAAAAHSILGPRLLAFQIGNEPDSFRGRYRPQSYTPADYIAEWNRFHDAIVKVTPQARFAGPDISNKLAYLTAFAEEARKHPDVVLLTSHYYAMGPARNPEATLENLLDPDPKLTTLKRRDLHVIDEACAVAGLAYRMSEGNSCWDGGKPGVSDTFASALWCADYMLMCMGRGWAGANMHGGGDGFYTPIAGTPSTGLTRRPEYFGMQFAKRFVGARVLTATLAGADPRVDAFAFGREGRRELVIVNKTAQAVSVDLLGGFEAAERMRLQGPAIDAKDGTELTSVKGSASRTLTAPPYTATAFLLSSEPKLNC